MIKFKSKNWNSFAAKDLSSPRDAETGERRFAQGEGSSEK